MSESSDPRREPLERNGVLYIVRQHISALVFLALMLGSARVWTWYDAFVVTGVVLAIRATTALVCVRINPAVLNARGTRHALSRPEKVFFTVYVPASLLSPVVAGLDVGAEGWTHASTVEFVVGLVAMALGGAITISALAANAFFEPTVRIQTDRGQQVCTRGPYRVIRHPGYVGAMLALMGVPLILGSRWAFVPAAVIWIALILRTAREDRMLRKDLEGYAAYAERTRYRLLPGVW